MQPNELLVDTLTYLSPPRALEGLSSTDAERKIPDAPHSIAEILAHLSFWQEWLCTRCAGRAEPMPATASAGWPALVPGSWSEIHARFIGGLERANSLGRETERLGLAIAPPIEFPPLAHYSIGDALVHVAQHNAHHMGQVILLRQMMGLWPPPAGSWTW
jgi:uncharacterized damage-inducible protein DinB